jgi:hypothetical protein
MRSQAEAFHCGYTIAMFGDGAEVENLATGMSRACGRRFRFWTSVMPRYRATVLGTLLAIVVAGCTSAGNARNLPVSSVDVPPGRNFSGAWALDASASQTSVTGSGRGSGAGTGQGGGLGLGPPPAQLTIRQSASELVVENAAGSSRGRLTYRLDGTAVRNVVLVGGGAARGAGMFTSAWHGDSLVTEFAVQVSRVPVRRYREIRWLSADGALIVEIVALDRRGAGRRGVYRRPAGGMD